MLKFTPDPDSGLDAVWITPDLVTHVSSFRGGKVAICFGSVPVFVLGDPADIAMAIGVGVLPANESS